MLSALLVGMEKCMESGSAEWLEYAPVSSSLSEDSYRVVAHLLLLVAQFRGKGLADGDLPRYVSVVQDSFQKRLKELQTIDKRESAITPEDALNMMTLEEIDKKKYTYEEAPPELVGRLVQMHEKALAKTTRMIHANASSGKKFKPLMVFVAEPGDEDDDDDLEGRDVEQLVGQRDAAEEDGDEQVLDDDEDEDDLEGEGDKPAPTLNAAAAVIALTQNEREVFVSRTLL